MIFVVITLAGMIAATVALDRRRRKEERKPIPVRVSESRPANRARR